ERAGARFPAAPRLRCDGRRGAGRGVRQGAAAGGAVRRRPRDGAPRRRTAVSVAGRVRDKLDRLRSELARDDLDRTGRALHIAGLSLASAGLYPALSVAHERFYELTAAPRQFRGLRDLRIRLAVPSDAPALSALDGTERWRFEDRLARG